MRTGVITIAGICCFLTGARVACAMPADEACAKALLLRQRAQLADQQLDRQAAQRAETERRRGETLRQHSEKLDSDLASSRERTGSQSYNLRLEAEKMRQRFSDGMTAFPEVNNYIMGLFDSMISYSQTTAACAAAPTTCQMQKLECPAPPKAVGFDIRRIGKVELKQESKASKQANAEAAKYRGVCQNWSGKMDRSLREMHTLSWNLDSSLAGGGGDFPSAFQPLQPKTVKKSGEKAELLSRAEELETIADAVSGETKYCYSPRAPKPEVEPFAQEAGVLAAAAYSLENIKSEVDGGRLGGSCATASGLPLAYCRRQTALLRRQEAQALLLEVPDRRKAAERAAKIARASGDKEIANQAKEAVKSLDQTAKEVADFADELNASISADNAAIFAAASSHTASGFGIKITTSPGSCQDGQFCPLAAAFEIAASTKGATAVLWDNTVLHPVEKTVVSAKSCLPCGGCAMTMSDGMAKVDASASQRGVASCTRAQTAQMRAAIEPMKSNSPDAAVRMALDILDAPPERIALFAAGPWVEVYYTDAVFSAKVLGEHAEITVESGSVLCSTIHGLVTVHAGSTAEFEIGILLRIMK